MHKCTSLLCTTPSGVSTSEPLCTYQSIEKPESFRCCKPFKMHLKPVTKFPELKSESNNIWIGSWTPFHQMFDGLNTNDGLPFVAVKPVLQGEYESSFMGEPP